MRTTATMCGFLILLFGGVVHAAGTAFNAIEKPYGVYEIAGDPEERHVLYGRLDRYPDTYEITAEEPFTLMVAIDAIAIGNSDQTNYTGIVVRRAEKGRVEEVARLKQASWEQFSAVTALTYRAGPRYEAALEAGVYRIEISTPDNVGQYRVTLGSGSAGGWYFSRVADIRAIHAFYGYGPLKLLASPLVYWPLLLLFGIGSLWGYRVYRSRQTTTSLPRDTK